MPWNYWDGETWREVTEAELAELAPDIVCGRLSGGGALDPTIRIAVGDLTSVSIARAQHQRFTRSRGKK